MAALIMTAPTARAFPERQVRSSRTQSAVVVDLAARRSCCPPKMALQIVEAGAPTLTAPAGLEQIRTNYVVAQPTDTLDSLTQQIDASFVAARWSGASITFVQLVLASIEPAWGSSGRHVLLDTLIRQTRQQTDERYEIALLLVAGPHSEVAASAFELLDRLMPSLDARGTLRLRFTR